MQLPGQKQTCVFAGRLIPAGTGYSYYQQVELDRVEGKFKIAK